MRILQNKIIQLPPIFQFLHSAMNIRKPTNIANWVLLCDDWEMEWPKDGHSSQVYILERIWEKPWKSISEKLPRI